MVHIVSNTDTTTPQLLSTVSVKDNNLQLKLEGECLTLKADGDWIGSVPDLIDTLYQLIELKEKSIDAMQ